MRPPRHQKVIESQPALNLSGIKSEQVIIIEYEWPSDIDCEDCNEATSMIEHNGATKVSAEPVLLDHEWAVILAGGDGTRLKTLTRRIAGDERPKQFCLLLGRATLIEETRGRAPLELAPERTL